jgi:hypothetical protein
MNVVRGFDELEPCVRSDLRHVADNECSKPNKKSLATCVGAIYLVGTA